MSQGRSGESVSTKNGKKSKLTADEWRKIQHDLAMDRQTDLWLKLHETDKTMKTQESAKR